MTVRELETLLGAGGRRHLLFAYKTESYLKQARWKNYNVPPERITAVIESINQHEKELKALKKELSSLL